VLDYENSAVDAVLLAAAMASWHFMMRSADTTNMTCING
jgi:hypothetical protein